MKPGPFTIPVTRAVEPSGLPARDRWLGVTP